MAFRSTNRSDLFLDRKGHESERDPAQLKKVSDYLTKMGLMVESGMQDATITVNGIEVIVEIADCDQSRQRGLMQRAVLDENCGMLFVFEDLAPRSFWMKETYIPLSIAYMDDSGTITNIQDMAPLDLSSVRSRAPARYALEMNEGWFERNGVRAGDHIDLSWPIVENTLQEAAIESVEDVKTIGDLKQLIKHATRKKKGEAGGKGLANTALDIVVDEIGSKIPGFPTVKNLAMAAKAAYKLDDEAKIGSGLNALNVDDDISKVVDDPVENAFMKAFAEKIVKSPDDTPIANINVTDALTNWISREFNNTQLEKPKSESAVRRYVRGLLVEKDVQPIGMCFPFAYQKAEEWFDNHFIKGKPGRAPQKHRDLNNKDKFKVVHGTVTDKWKSPPKPIVHGWVEMGDLVFDSQTRGTKPNGIDKEFYYDMYQPEVYKEFTAEEAIVNCVRYGGEGPWDDELYAMHQKRDAWMNESLLRRTVREMIKESAW